MTEEQRAVIAEAVREAAFHVRTVETMIPATPEAFRNNGSWERDPYPTLRAIYASLRDQQYALKLIAEVLDAPQA